MPREREVRISLTVPAETKEAIDALADAFGESVASTIKILVADGLFVQAVKSEGSQIRVITQGGDEYLIEGPGLPDRRRLGG